MSDGQLIRACSTAMKADVNSQFLVFRPFPSRQRYTVLLLRLGDSFIVHVDFHKVVCSGIRSILQVAHDLDAYAHKISPDQSP
jgi:hypothetical protein